MPTMQITRECSPFGEQVFIVEFDYTPFRPGRYSGPMEDCYPDEPEELEITSIKLRSFPLIAPDTELMPHIDNIHLDDIYDAVLEELPGALEVDIPERDICIDYGPEDAP